MELDSISIFDFEVVGCYVRCVSGNFVQVSCDVPDVLDEIPGARLYLLPLKSLCFLIYTKVIFSFDFYKTLTDV